MARLTLDSGGYKTTYEAKLKPELEARLKEMSTGKVDEKQLEGLLQDITADGKVTDDEKLVAIALADATAAGDKLKVTLQSDGFETTLNVPPEAAASLRQTMRSALAGIAHPTEAVPVALSTVLNGELPPSPELRELFPPPPPPAPPTPAGAEVVVVSAVSADDPSQKRAQQFSKDFTDTKLPALNAGDTVSLDYDIWHPDENQLEKNLRTLEYLHRLGVPLELTFKDGTLSGAAIEKVEAGLRWPQVTAVMEATGNEQSLGMEQLKSVRVLGDVPAVDLNALPAPKPMPKLTPALVDLDAAIAASGLTADDVKALKAGGAKFETVYDFAKQRATGDTKPSPEHMVGVGLYIQKDDIVKLALDQAANVVQWDVAYYEMGMQPFNTKLENHTQVFLEMVTSRDVNVTFFVPDNLMNDPNGKFTKKEMHWFLENAERAKNVTFVFGAEKALDFDQYRKLAMSYSDHNQMWGAIVNALKQGPA
jgi:hypothetical protein